MSDLPRGAAFGYSLTPHGISDCDLLGVSIVVVLMMSFLTTVDDPDGDIDAGRRATMFAGRDEVDQALIAIRESWPNSEFFVWEAPAIQLSTRLGHVAVVDRFGTTQFRGFARPAGRETLRIGTPLSRTLHAATRLATRGPARQAEAAAPCHSMIDMQSLGWADAPAYRRGMRLRSWVGSPGATGSIDWLECSPVGNGRGLWSVLRGFHEVNEPGRIDEAELELGRAASGADDELASVTQGIARLEEFLALQP